MYDFCITPIYAFLLGCGGLAGYFIGGSTTSLTMGGGAALALFFLTWVSMQQFEVTLETPEGGREGVGA